MTGTPYSSNASQAVGTISEAIPLRGGTRATFPMPEEVVVELVITAQDQSSKLTYTLVFMQVRLPISIRFIM